MYWFVKSALIFLAVYLVFTVGMYVFQRKMIYCAYDTDLAIKDVPLEHIELVTTKNEQGHVITSWYIPASIKQNSTIVWFHGNAINYKDSLILVAPYVQAGYGILFAEYPGFSGNVGSPTEEGIYSNSRAFINWLLEDKGIPENKIILYGQSIGGGAAVQMATEYTNIKTLVLESPFTSLVDVVKRSFFFLPVNILVKDRFENDKKIKTVKTPTLFVCGAEDTIISPNNSKILFALSAAKNKKNVLISGAGHNDLYKHDVEQTVIRTLKEGFN